MTPSSQLRHSPQAPLDEAQDSVTAGPSSQLSEQQEPLLPDSTGTSAAQQPEPDQPQAAALLLQGDGLRLPLQLRSAAAVHYPLTNRSLASAWPGNGEYSGQAEGPATWVEDDTFGSALYCIKGRPLSDYKYRRPLMHACMMHACRCWTLECRMPESNTAGATAAPPLPLMSSCSLAVHNYHNRHCYSRCLACSVQVDYGRSACLHLLPSLVLLPTRYACRPLRPSSGATGGATGRRQRQLCSQCVAQEAPARSVAAPGWQQPDQQ